MWSILPNPFGAAIRAELCVPRREGLPHPLRGKHVPVCRQGGAFSHLLPPQVRPACPKDDGLVRSRHKRSCEVSPESFVEHHPGLFDNEKATHQKIQKMREVLIRSHFLLLKVELELFLHLLGLGGLEGRPPRASKGHHYARLQVQRSCYLTRTRSRSFGMMTTSKLYAHPLCHGMDSSES